MKKTTLILAVLFMGQVLCSNGWAIPLLEYTQTSLGTNYSYAFSLINDNVSPIDELYIEFALNDPSADFIDASLPAGWDYFDGPGQDLNTNNNYWVGFTAGIGNELQTNLILNGFSITTASNLTGFDFSWNWDRTNLSTATAPAPVPEPASLLLIGSGLVGLAGLRKRFKR